jgi:integrase
LKSPAIPGRFTKTWREVPITKDFAGELKEMQKEAKTGYIVEYNGRPIRRIQGSWRSAVKAAGINYQCVFYDVRHLFATTLLNRGADLLSVSALMGHASVKMTADVYGHACAKSMRKTIGLL